MKVFVPFSLEEKGTKENIRNRQRTSREGLALEQRGFIEEEAWRIFGCIRMSMKPQSLDGMAHRTGGTISAARKVGADPKNVGMEKASDGIIGTHADDFMAESERIILGCYSPRHDTIHEQRACYPSPTGVMAAP